jgi:hypothetical protein
MHALDLMIAFLRHRCSRHSYFTCVYCPGFPVLTKMGEAGYAGDRTLFRDIVLPMIFPRPFSTKCLTHSLSITPSFVYLLSIVARENNSIYF